MKNRDLKNPFEKTLPIDLAPKQVRMGKFGPMPGPMPALDVENEREKLFRRITENTDLIVSTFVLEKGPTARNLTITTTPTRIIDGRFPRGYILLNPTAAQGLTTTATLLASAARTGTGNSQASPLGVASFEFASLFLDITAVSGGATVVIDTQSQDPISLNWATAQSDIFTAPSAVGTTYASLGRLGVDRSLAVAFNVAAGSATFSVGAVLKGGLAGGGTGLANTIYLGGNANVSSTTGYPLIEGQSERWYFRDNAELWAVSLISGGVTLSIFDLQ